jgi:hypothetical protein
MTSLGVEKGVNGLLDADDKRFRVALLKFPEPAIT